MPPRAKTKLPPPSTAHSSTDAQPVLQQGAQLTGGQRRTFVARAQADSDQRGLCSLGRNRATWKLGYRRPLARRSRISDALVWHRPHRSRHCLS